MDDFCTTFAKLGSLCIHFGRLNSCRVPSERNQSFKLISLKIPTTKGHQTLQPINKLIYNKHKAKGHDQHFVLLSSFTRSRVQHKFCRTVGLSYSLQIYFCHQVYRHPAPQSKIQHNQNSASHRSRNSQDGNKTTWSKEIDLF